MIDDLEFEKIENIIDNFLNLEKVNEINFKEIYFEKLKGILRKKTFFDTFRWISQAVKPVFSVAKESPFLPLGKYTADMLLYRSRQYLYA